MAVLVTGLAELQLLLILSCFFSDLLLILAESPKWQYLALRSKPYCFSAWCRKVNQRFTLNSRLIHFTVTNSVTVIAWRHVETTVFEGCLIELAHSHSGHGEDCIRNLCRLFSRMFTIFTLHFATEWLNTAGFFMAYCLAMMHNSLGNSW
jgi:hypothetical protein